MIWGNLLSRSGWYRVHSHGSLEWPWRPSSQQPSSARHYANCTQIAQKGACPSTSAFQCCASLFNRGGEEPWRAPQTWEVALVHATCLIGAQRELRGCLLDKEGDDSTAHHFKWIDKLKKIVQMHCTYPRMLKQCWTWSRTDCWEKRKWVTGKKPNPITLLWTWLQLEFCM